MYMQMRGIQEEKYFWAILQESKKVKKHLTLDRGVMMLRLIVLETWVLENLEPVILDLESLEDEDDDDDQ